MSNLEMIVELCGIVQLQSRIIDAQAASLAQLGAAVMEEEIAEARVRANHLCGDDG